MGADLMRSHLRGQVVTMSSLASASEVPFASAMRRIHKLIEQGDIETQERGPNSKSSIWCPASGCTAASSIMPSR